MGNLDPFGLIALLVAWLAAAVLKQRKSGRARPGSPQPAGGGRAAPDPAERVREEVRRKIAARRGVQAAPPALAEPAVGPWSVPSIDVIAAQAQKPAAAPFPAAVQAGVPPPASPAVEAGPPPAVHPWLAELRQPSSIRRIVVLREILGPPAALR